MPSWKDEGTESPTFIMDAFNRTQTVTSSFMQLRAEAKLDPLWRPVSDDQTSPTWVSHQTIRMTPINSLVWTLKTKANTGPSPRQESTMTILS